eukprot:GHRR01032580.1.p1 GENE.GHRR01032580.1~~GHRR01032580.1.p1  ORF type:complete len:116 (-),score=26.37 GHRR01032580.1:619-966(-)
MPAKPLCYTLLHTCMSKPSALRNTLAGVAAAAMAMTACCPVRHSTLQLCVVVPIAVLVVDPSSLATRHMPGLIISELLLWLEAIMLIVHNVAGVNVTRTISAELNQMAAKQLFNK